MSALALARWQFGITTVYHFFFVPLTLGLSILLAVMETLWVRTGNPLYRRMVRFWGRLFLINFAMGVVTGIVQEFQFGMNWSEYSRFVGDVFGAPLAIEALLAFFLESTFLGLWVFGWKVLSPRLHLAAIWLVAIGSNLSALWILIANSWMHQPVGFEIDAASGRARLTDFAAVLANPHVPLQFGHVFFAGWATAAFFVLGISAWHLVRGRDEDAELFRRSFRMAAAYGVAGSLLVAALGHLQGQHVVRAQPMKMAAAEALWETENPAGFTLVARIDERAQRNPFALRIPAALSLMAFNRPEGEIKGIKPLQAEMEARHGPGDYVPPVAVSFWSFRAMVAAGGAMILLALYALGRARRADFGLPRAAGLILTAAIALPYVANSTGWILTEMGRQPWIVYGVLKTADAVSPGVGAGAVLFSLVAFTLVYGALMAVDIYLLRKFSRLAPAAGPED
jgi:cytochrome d ubiquinol oxidase subunit I